jgi:hypothetical protein
MDGFKSSNSATTRLYHEEDHPTDIEVYLLFKALHSNSYFPDRHISHHILLLKLSQQYNTFYYTDLDSSNFRKGRITIVFGPYHFYPQKTIYFQPLGISRNRTLAEIRHFAEMNSFNGQNFSMFTQELPTLRLIVYRVPGTRQEPAAKRRCVLDKECAGHHTETVVDGTSVAAQSSSLCNTHLFFCDFTLFVTFGSAYMDIRGGIDNKTD